MFPFDYDRDYLQPEPEKDDYKDPDSYIFVNGRWVRFEED